MWTWFRRIEFTFRRRDKQTRGVHSLPVAESKGLASSEIRTRPLSSGHARFLYRHAPALLIPIGQQ